jgi:CheY-specific phosphatase CheX
MPESLESVLLTATQTTLETTAFMFADLDAPEEVAAEPTVVATVRFTGAHAGAVSIDFPVRLMPQLAANVLGEEETPSDDMQRDAVGELANIVCGTVLPALDEKGKYALGAPALGTTAAVDATSLRVATAVLYVEGARVCASLWACTPETAGVA